MHLSYKFTSLFFNVVSRRHSELGLICYTVPYNVLSSGQMNIIFNQ